MHVPLEQAGFPLPQVHSLRDVQELPISSASTLIVNPSVHNSIKNNFFITSPFFILIIFYHELF